MSMHTVLILAFIAILGSIIVSAYARIRKNMSPWFDAIALPILISIFAGLVVSLVPREEKIYAKGFAAAEGIYQMRLENAVEAYAARLGELIVPTTGSFEVPPKVRARAIVSLRNDLRASLTSLPKLLNSEIDSLAILLAADKGDTEKIEETLDVLRLKWPAKSTQIKMETRKLVAELGFSGSLKDK